MSNGNARRGFFTRRFGISAGRNCFGFFIAAGVLVAGQAALAASVTITKDMSSPLSTTAIATADTNGGKMGGTVVTAGFSDGTTQSGVWAPVTPSIGQVLTDLFLLGAGNTASSSWLLMNLNPNALLTRLTIDVGAGSHVFDTALPNQGTENSLAGLNFSDSLGFPGSISVTYSRPVGLTGADPLGDIFTVMTVNFAGLEGGGIATYVSGLGFNFLQDTDALARAGDLSSPAVPVPGALPLFVSGLGGLGLLMYRRRRRPINP